MLITEKDLAAYREIYGLDKELLLLRPPHFRSPEWEKFSGFHNALPEGFFSGTWNVFRDELPEPKNYGDGPEGREALEIILVLAFTDRIPVLNNHYKWMALDHQAGGICCHHPLMIAFQLFPRPDIYPALRNIARKRWPNDCGDRFDGSDRPDHIMQLRNDLQVIGIDCEYTAEHLDESLYPIDASQNNIDFLTISTPRLEELIPNWADNGNSANLSLFILTQNSD